MKRDKFYIDTNILYLLVAKKEKEFTKETSHFLNSPDIDFLVSSVSVQELIQLCQKGRLCWWDKGDNRNLSAKIMEFLMEKNIQVVPPVLKDLMVLADLPFYYEHKDVNDRMIIAQAISRHIPLISTDWSFDRYTTYGLDLVFNER